MAVPYVRDCVTYIKLYSMTLVRSEHSAAANTQLIRTRYNTMDTKEIIREGNIRFRR
jgi:hypothetical protein